MSVGSVTEQAARTEHLYSMTHCMNAILLTLEVIFAIKPKLLTQIMCMKTWKRNNPVQILFTITLHRSLSIAVSGPAFFTVRGTLALDCCDDNLGSEPHTDYSVQHEPPNSDGCNLNATCVVTNPFLDKQCHRKQSKCAAIVCWLMVVMKKNVDILRFCKYWETGLSVCLRRKK